jgi:hypothetical protein
MPKAVSVLIWIHVLVAAAFANPLAGNVMGVWPVAVAVAVPGIQLNPSLVPHKAPRPVLPRIDQNACPFEGCQFGRWTVRQSVRLYSTWKANRTLTATLRKGQVVTAISGIHITFAPSEVLVTAPIEQYDLKTGDHVFGYMHLGEGFFNAWFNGWWVDSFDGSGVAPACSRDCHARLVNPGRMEWWVQIEANRATGWTNQTDRFDGKDALAK